MIDAEKQAKSVARAKAQAELQANIRAAAEWADQNDVRTIHCRPYNGDLFGGSTIAFRKSGFNFIDLSVAHCSPRDMFNKKVGRMIAMNNMKNGQFIKIRVPAYLMEHNMADMPEHILENMEILFPF